MNDLFYVAVGAACMSAFFYFCIGFISAIPSKKEGELFDRCSSFIGIVAVLSEVALLITYILRK
jgi:hypothetical protein